MKKLTTSIQNSSGNYLCVVAFTFIALLHCTSLCLANEPNVITDDASNLKVIDPLHNKNHADGNGTKYDVDNNNIGNDSDSKKHGVGHHSKGLVVASWNYHEVRDPFIFTIILVLAGICKIAYHHAGFLSSKVPESCILVILGIMFGALIYFTDAQETFPTFFKPHEFFIFLLPPIILEAAFSLHDRTFIENLGSILLFAVVGTVLACICVGISLFGLAKAGAMGSIADLSFVELMVFSSLIVAVDPVAVLAVFNEIGVNHVLYFLVFGESLLNDGVTVVLYKVFQAYNVMDEITGVHIFLGIVKFFVVCVGGLFLGVLAGIASAFMTKYATKVKVTQPLIIYTMAYLGFLCAELFEFSGIISIIGCGITQKQYAFNNISDKSKMTLNYFTKVISTACETIIFMFLGLAMVNDQHVWHTGFTIWTIVLCNVYRFLIIFGLSFLINKLDIYRVRKISIDEQFMIAYGGLRGAVCFSLVALLSPEEFPNKNMFVTTTLAVIIFTVFIQGITIKPLVYLFQIKLAPEKSKSMYKELHEHVTDHLMAGVEDVIGEYGKNHLREKIKHLDVMYIQPLLLVNPDPCDTQLKEFYEHLVLKEHYSHMKLSNAKQMEQMPEFLRYLDDDRPHVTTELFLKGLLSNPISGDINKEGTTPMIQIEGARPLSGHEEEGILRNRGATGRSRENVRSSTLKTPLSSTSFDISASGLRTLLKQNTNSRVSRYDPNLTATQDFMSEFTKKTCQNRRLQRLSSQDGVTPALATQLSWSENDSDACVQRRNLSVLNSAPRHAMTMDMQNHGRQATVDPLPLDSVLEADERDNRSGDEELQPMIGEDREEDEEVRLNRHGRRSTKHRLERQGGMDRHSSEPVVKGQDVAMKDLGGGGGDGGDGSNNDGSGGEIVVGIEGGNNSTGNDSSKV